MFVEKVIKTAFGFNTCQDIDVVYPKDKSITHLQLTTLLKRLFSYKLSDTTCGNVSKIMTIESMFSKTIDDNEFDNDECEFVNISRPKRIELDDRTIFGILNSYCGQKCYKDK
jgi:hypothetical protein